jgi:predicted nucleic acid-binding protein
VITLDTSGVLALVNRSDPDHASAREALGQAGQPHVVPAGILAEICYLLEARMPTVVDAFLGDLESGAFTLDCGDQDIGRVRELVERYADLPLGCADATVIACAERNGGLVLTLDRRDFGVVAREGLINVVPALYGP